MRRKILCILMALCVLVSVNATTTVNAATITFSTKKPSQMKFSSAWERTRDIHAKDTAVVVGTLCYGYNTFAINEDYVWTRSAIYGHKSVVKNAKGSFSSSKHKATTTSRWAKIEVTHKGTSPTYKIVFTNVLDGVTKSELEMKNPRITHNKW